jgi:hypothetical protein
LITQQQAIKACILAQFLTRVGLAITTFRYYRVRKIIFLEVGYNGEIAVEINERGDFINV